MISKIIWQTHEYEYEDLPKEYKHTSSVWKEKCSGWEYVYHSARDRRSFIEEKFPEYLHLYDYIGPNIYKADFWRYLVLYEYGGIYADLDSVLEIDINSEEAKEKIDFNAGIVVASNLAEGVYNNCCIMAAPKNEVILKVIDSMIEKCKEQYDRGDTNETAIDMWVRYTGPPMYSNVISDNIKDVFLSEMPVRHCDSFKDLVDKKRKFQGYAQ